MHYLIYKITNKLNNKIYIGKHKTENKDDNYFGSGLLLSRSVEKHGQENFTKEILFECKTEEEMNQKEADIVDEEFVARDDTYNIKLGGVGGFDYINSIGKNIYNDHSNITKRTLDKHRDKSVKKFKERLRDDPELWIEIQQKLRNGYNRYVKFMGKNPFEGRRHTEETILKMKKSKKGVGIGKENSQYGTRWITNGTSSKKIGKDQPIPTGWVCGRKQFIE